MDKCYNYKKYSRKISMHRDVSLKHVAKKSVDSALANRTGLKFIPLVSPYKMQ